MNISWVYIQANVCLCMYCVYVCAYVYTYVLYVCAHKYECMCACCVYVCVSVLWVCYVSVLTLPLCNNLLDSVNWGVYV